jgi:hypothetical protein
MELMREKWTDERLDDLNQKVDRGFDAMERRFEAVDRRFEALERRFDRMYWFMTTGFLTLAGLIVERT